MRGVFVLWPNTVVVLLVSFNYVQLGVPTPKKEGEYLAWTGGSFRPPVAFVQHEGAQVWDADFARFPDRTSVLNRSSPAVSLQGCCLCLGDPFFVAFEGKTKGKLSTL